MSVWGEVIFDPRIGWQLRNAVTPFIGVHKKALAEPPIARMQSRSFDRWKSIG